MPYSFEEFDPPDLSALGKCGIVHTLNVEAQRQVIFDGRNNVLDDFFSFESFYHTRQGCMWPQLWHRPQLRVQDTRNNPTTEIIGIDWANPGTFRRRVTYTIQVDASFADFCGPCTNPEKISVSQLTYTANSLQDPTLAASLWVASRRFADGLPTDPKDVGVPELKRVIRDWVSVYNLKNKLPGVPKDPCAPENRTNCTTP